MCILLEATLIIVANRIGRVWTNYPRLKCEAYGSHKKNKSEYIKKVAIVIIELGKII